MPYCAEMGRGPPGWAARARLAPSVRGQKAPGVSNLVQIDYGRLRLAACLLAKGSSYLSGFLRVYQGSLPAASGQ
jgi:hypothetical protein